MCSCTSVSVALLLTLFTIFNMSGWSFTYSLSAGISRDFIPCCVCNNPIKLSRFVQFLWSVFISFKVPSSLSAGALPKGGDNQQATTLRRFLYFNSPTTDF
ncbi:unnamed protein product [Clavelina lepadiformis]|uniref:Secreted protein n=1 Tax=Clavelina lepadiformis TaxID=159417 RepID=A0ABP0GWT1_CLALP